MKKESNHRDIPFEGIFPQPNVSFVSISSQPKKKRIYT